MTYKYYFSYIFKQGINHGYAGTFITTDKDVFDVEVFEGIKKLIKDNEGHEEITILNFVRKGEHE